MEDKTYRLYLHHENYDHQAHPELLGRNSWFKRTIRKLSGSFSDLDVTTPFRLTRWRWVALFLMNMLLLGYFAVFDSPQPLQTAIKTSLQINDQQYSYLYSFLAIPNLILPLVAGYIIDVIGIRPSMAIFGTFVLGGQIILSLGAEILNFEMMVAGRMVYSLGADPLNIAQVVMINRWFKSQELGLALASGTLMGGVGKALCSLLIPVIYESTRSLGAAFGFGAGLCFFSFICVIIMIIWDQANERRELALDPGYFLHAENAEKFNLKDIKKFKLIVWLLVINFGLSDGIIFTLRSFLNELYSTLYAYSTVRAGNFISIHYLAMAISSPLMGKFIDKFGLRATIILYNSLLSVIGLFFYIVTPTCNQCSAPIIPLILFGLFIGIHDAAAFAALPLILNEKYLGTGYGLFYVVENLLLTVLPPIGGAIKGSYSSEITGYFWVVVFLLGLSTISMFESLVLFMYDRRCEDRILDKTVFKKEDEFKVDSL